MSRTRYFSARPVLTSPESPLATSTSRTTHDRWRSRRMDSATSTGPSRRSRDTASIRSLTCTPCPARRTITGTLTTPHTSPHSGSTDTSRTGSCTCGRPSPTTIEATPGWRATTWLNEPADESRSVVGPFYRRLVAAIRAVDPDHTVFLDGNTY